MALITKPDFTYVWASGGAVVAPNDTKKQQGWVAEAPPFQYDNWLQNRQDQMLAHINQRGIPTWDALTNYEAGSLSYVQGSDGKIYKSVAASGPSATVQNPTTDITDTYWTVAFADVGAFLSQAAADARYLRILNNGSDINNAVTFRTNIGVVPSSETQAGLIEIATTSEVVAGTDTARAVTPAGLLAGIIGTAVFAGDGYAILPVKVGGVRRDLIVQWMEIDFGGTANTNKNWPIQFPNALFAAFATDAGNVAPSAAYVATWRFDTSTTTTGFFSSNSTAVGRATALSIGW